MFQLRKILPLYLSIALIIITGTGAISATRYKMTVLGTLEPGARQQATGINDNGVIAGIATTNGPNDQAYVAIKWDTSGIPTLLNPGGTVNSQAYAIDSQGRILGESDNKVVIWDAESNIVHNLGSGYMRVMNDSCQVAGMSYTDNKKIIWSEQGNVTLNAYWSNDWSNGGLSIADISNSGQCIGVCYGSRYKPHAAIWDAQGNPTLLTEPEGMDDSYAEGINDLGVIVGYSTKNYYTPYPHIIRAVKWDSEGVPHYLQELPGIIDRSIAKAINNAGTIIGYSGDQPIVWATDGTITELETPLGAMYTDVTAINNSGLIVGYAMGPNTTQAIIWTPVPEPGSLITIACGICAVFSMASRRRKS